VRRRNGGDRRGGGTSRRRPISGPARATALAALASALVSCATGIPRRTAAPPARAAEIALRWEAFRSSVLARPAAELFYEARFRRSILSGTFLAAVRDEPGRTLSVVVEGPLGAVVARARWDGKTTVIERAGRDAGGDLPTLADLGVPIPARSLSLLLFGLPDEGPPEAFSLAGGAPWVSWRGGALACEFDDSGMTVRRILFREGGPPLDIRYSGWDAGIPSRIAIRISGGGRADLIARPGERQR